MTKYALFLAVSVLGTVPLTLAQQKPAGLEAERIVLGQLANGADVIFARASTGDWGIEISGSAVPRETQAKPAQIEVYRGDNDIRELAAGYESLRKEAGGVIARAMVDGGDASFAVEDHWKISGDVISLSRTVSVTGAEQNAGFSSAIRLVTPPTVTWPDLIYLAPGLLYGDPSHDGDSSPGGVLNDRARRFEIREDLMSAPLFALSFRDGPWIAVLDPEPRGDTTWTETTASATQPIIDERIQFGAVGAREVPGGGVEYGFWFPGTTHEFTGGRFNTPIVPAVRRRYHPVKAGFRQSYQVKFRFGRSSSFLGVERDAWRWAWQTLNPPVMHLDLEIVRRELTDHLANHVLTVDDRAGVPFLFDAVTGNPGSYRNWSRYRNSFPAPPQRPPNTPVTAHELSPEKSVELATWARTVGVYVDPSANELEQWPKVIMGFVSKGVEVADQLLIEADRDQTPRGERMRKEGLAIIDTYIRLVPMSPPAGEGFNLWTGEADSWAGDTVTLRGPSEGVRTLLDAYRREKQLGREHPEWLHWSQQFGDWLLTQQHEDGSFPRSWRGGTGEVREVSGTSSYNPVPVLVKLNEETGQRRYLDAAIRAANYVWDNFGSHGVYVGGTTDNPNITDKEAGMLSLEAFLDLYDATKEPKWLDRAIAAGNYTESWIWIWNVPMPLGAIDSDLNWKRGVPTVGVQGITARGGGGVDEYLDWAVPAYARLYRYTHDEHYLDVARILLLDTKSMLALPGRTYDLLGPGWQQEHWGMGPNTRGFGTHRSWLPWVSVNHLHSITGLEEFDTALYQRLAKGQ